MKKKHHKKSKTVWYKNIYIIVGSIFALYFVYSFFFSSSPMSALGFVRNVRRDMVLHMPHGDLYVEIAKTQQERETGLSYRSAIGDNEGMLFTFDVPGKYGFWMKDMNFPIDMVWLSQDGHVVYVQQNVATSTYPEAFINAAPAQYVIEMAPNMSEKYGLYLGAKVDLSSIPQ